MSLAVTNLALSPSSISYASVNVNKPDGTSLSSLLCQTANPGCELHFSNLPQTGTYSVTISPGGSGQATMAFTATLSQDVSGTLSLSMPLNLNLASSGQSATLSFTLNSQQTVGVYLSSLSLSPTNTAMTAYVYNSSGTQVATGSTTTGTTLNLQSLAAGTYSVVVTPAYPAIGSLQVTLEPQTGGLLPADGSSSNYSTPGVAQNAYFSFSGSAGQSMSLALTNLVLSPSSISYVMVNISNPSGSSFTSSMCSVSSLGCELHLRNLPQTGTYSVVMFPGASGQATMSFTASLSQDVTGTLSSGTTLSVNLATIGQSASLSFTTAATQNVTLVISSISVVPAVTLYISAYNASNASQGSGTAITGTTINLGSLPAGTYSVSVSPLTSPTTGSFQISYH
jgi:large repetitive protein